jgi:general stress protein 26
MIGTFNKSRKFHNIQHNSNVSLVFGFDGKRALQYEGSARLVEGQELEERLTHHFVKHPGAAAYKDNPGNVYLVIEPSWIRLVEGGPKVVGEMRFDS